MSKRGPSPKSLKPDHPLDHRGKPLYGAAAASVAKATQERDRLTRLSIEVEGWFQGKTQTQIAASVGCTQQQVSIDLDEIQARFEQEQMGTINRHRARIVERIRHLSRYYWEGYFRSLGSQVTESTQTEETVIPQVGHGDQDTGTGIEPEQAEDEPPVLTRKDKPSKVYRADTVDDLVRSGVKRLEDLPVKVTETRKQVYRDGNPNWLRGVQWCIEEEAKILGLYPQPSAVGAGLNVSVATMNVSMNQAVLNAAIPTGGSQSTKSMLDKMNATLRAMPPHERTQALDMYRQIMDITEALDRLLNAVPPQSFEPDVEVIEGEARQIVE